MTWLQTHSGRKAIIEDPTPDIIDRSDIAHALSNTCRFNGHVSSFYSVAQHSIIVSRNLPDDLAFAGLLHDAAEAYVGDLIRPIKRYTEAGRLFSEIEDRWHRAIEQRFGLEPGSLDHPLIQAADRRALMTEKRDVVPSEQPAKWDEDGILPYPEKVVPWSPTKARYMFLIRWDELAPKQSLHQRVESLLAGLDSLASRME